MLKEHKQLKSVLLYIYQVVALGSFFAICGLGLLLGA